MEKNPINIKGVEGDVIGIDVDGNGNIIGKNISVVINQAQDYGISLLLQIISRSIQAKIVI
jgi:hypothetical protein